MAIEIDYSPLGFPISEAVEELRNGESSDICRHYGKSLDKLQEDATDLIAGLAWAHMRRRQAGVTWDVINNMTLRQTAEMFDKEPELEDAEVESFGLTGDAGFTDGEHSA